MDRAGEERKGEGERKKSVVRAAVPRHRIGSLRESPALKAHGILVKTVEQFGGVVYPPVYFHNGFNSGSATWCSVVWRWE